MNKLVTHQSPPNFWHPTWVSVEGTTAEGAQYTFGVIYRNKHGRSNLMRPGKFGDFMAGGKSQRRVEDYAKTVNPDSVVHVFIEARGVIRCIGPLYLWYCGAGLPRITGMGDGSQDAFSRLDPAQRQQIAVFGEFCVEIVEHRQINAPYSELRARYEWQQGRACANPPTLSRPHNGDHLR